ncbi:MAG TPA: hypothetical protein VFN35_00405 [Ktedonobacteraceae bacterium]|nr:hypothetical protein [Ktedonobacteraceae bacterium]
MSIASIQLQLLVGKVIPQPAPEMLVKALQNIDITQSQTAGFQMSFQIERATSLAADFPLLSSSLLQPGNRVVICVTIGAMPRVIMDGIITQHQFAYDQSGALLLTVTGEDLSLLMDLYDVSLEYPGMGDDIIANVILLKYAGFGITPLVIPPLSGTIELPTERIPQQNATDKQYLSALAAEHGYIFFVQPGVAPTLNTAYWGPVNRIGLPQKALTVDAGPETNVQSISFSYDALSPGPVQVYGFVSDETSESVLPLATFISTQVPPLSSMQPLLFNQPFVRKQLLDYQGASYIDAFTRAQAITNQSSDSVVTASGSLDVLRYGTILMAPGLVGVRGAGFSYDGYYFVRSVTHHIRIGQYTQDFSLAREGLGSTTGVML